MLIITIFCSVIITFLAIVLVKPLWLMNYLAPRRHSKRIVDLPYSWDERHTLDLYVPNDLDEDKPILVFVHGGSWDTGHKNDYLFAGYSLSEMGYITAIPNYRLYPQVQFPHFIEDVAAAIASLPIQISQLGIQVNGSLPIVLIGHSAGAHTAAMLTSRPEYLINAHADIELKALVGLAGPYDLPLDDELVVGKFDGVNLKDVSEQQIDLGHTHNGHDANPINLAHKNMPPTLLIHGEKDITVGHYHSERFNNRLEHLNVDSRYIPYKATNHRHLVGALSLFGRFLNPVYKDIQAFLKSL